MKKFTVVFILSLIACKLSAQTDTLPPYLQVPIIPPFKIQLTDSSWFSKSNLSNKKPTWVIYFSPDCGHCKTETEEILANIKSLKNVQVVMIASRPFADVKDFYNFYMINRFPNIKLGVDAVRFVTNFYKVEYTPFSALYDKKGDLVKAFRDAPEISEIISLTR